METNEQPRVRGKRPVTISDSERINFAIPDACAVLGCGRSYLYELIGVGKLAAKKMGAKTVIDAASLRAYAASLPPAAIGRRASAAE
jgi:excisionase family DNA binding protein